MTLASVQLRAAASSRLRELCRAPWWRKVRMQVRLHPRENWHWTRSSSRPLPCLSWFQTERASDWRDLKRGLEGLNSPVLLMTRQKQLWGKTPAQSEKKPWSPLVTAGSQDTRTEQLFSISVSEGGHSKATSVDYHHFHDPWEQKIRYDWSPLLIENVHFLSKFS